MAPGLVESRGVLAYPTSSEILYRARDEELTVARPLFTGDVFAGVTLTSGVEADVVLVQHPCSMRGGKTLRKRLSVCPVSRQKLCEVADWPNQYVDFMLLPDLRDGAGFEAACFRDAEPVATTELRRDRRIATLSDIGIAVLQQRYVHHLTRVVVDTPTLQEHIRPQVVEAELEEDWVEEALSVDDRKDDDVIAAHSLAFQEFLGDADSELRELLSRTASQGVVRQRVRAEIRQRFRGR